MIRIYTTDVLTDDDGTVSNPEPDEIIIDGATYTLRKD